MTATDTNGTTEKEAPFEAATPTAIPTMPMLTRDMILHAQDAQQEVVQVPEWGGSIIVRGLSGAERDRFEASVLQTNKRGDREVNLRNMRAKLAVLSCVDDSGQRLFQDSDVAVIGEKSASALQRIYDVAAKLSGISKDDAEELAKNSSADLSGGLSSDSL
jgi:hypothetical protein